MRQSGSKAFQFLSLWISQVPNGPTGCSGYCTKSPAFNTLAQDNIQVWIILLMALSYMDLYSVFQQVLQNELTPTTKGQELVFYQHTGLYSWFKKWHPVSQSWATISKCPRFHISTSYMLPGISMGREKVGVGTRKILTQNEGAGMRPGKGRYWHWYHVFQGYHIS